jgi:hypothetical protein
MSDADTVAYELATASAERRHELAAELDALRAFASCASANRRRLPSALQQLLAKLPGSPRRSCPPPEPAELEAGQSHRLI